MAKQFYQLSGSDLLVWDDPQNITTQAEIQALIDALIPFQSLPDDSRTKINESGGVATAGVQGGFPSLQDFDDALTDEIERLQDIRDYYDYEAKQETLGNVRDGDWFIPEAVEAFSSELVGSEATLAIDGDNATGWEAADEPASITFRLRSYRKNVESIRLWIPNNTLKTELQGLDISAAQSLSQIDEPSNVVASGLNLAHTPGTAFQVVPFDFKKRCRYIKLSITGSNHAQNSIMIRSIEARVVVFNHDK